ncbi:F-box protein SKIP23 [Jatropha curcas]|uniref:F-box protein SKIP23 n=1 Tax=Jatropha curcas TaxID=180498 RepID=UPI0018940544|nr:F-box protein SKIP23 [Jatropha curcas]
MVLLVDMGDLCLWRIGDEKWTNIDRGFADIIFHNGKFYALDCNGSYFCGDDPTHLVESLEDLFLLLYLSDSDYDSDDSQYDSDNIIPIKVYKLEEGKNKWVKVEGLEDRMLFIGDESCFSCFVNDLPGAKGNCKFTDKLIKNEDLSADQKDEFKARKLREKTLEEMSEETKEAYRNMKFYNFYPVQTPDTPDVSNVKERYINRYYDKAHEVL